ncbi:MAG: SAVED domain-containing protein, partial [Desulfuromonadaceae bacterium]|nr:SAVED domain-containing protein [Desulfuromonadaceae bacterium]
HGARAEIHLFPAIPASVAVKLGKLLLPKVDPPIHVYEYHQQQGGFNYALTVLKM